MSDDSDTKTLPLIRQSTDREIVGVAPARFKFSTSGVRLTEEGDFEARCPICKGYFSEDNPHTDALCEANQLLNLVMDT
jgi:hypothetical protein